MSHTVWWALAVAAVLLLLAGCTDMLRSDSANSARRSNQARNAAVVGNQEASRQAAPATAMHGSALVQLLAGKSHVSEFRKRSGDAQPYYVSYSHFRPDGSFVSSDTYSRHSPAEYVHGQWRVTDQLLCITGKDGNPLEQCFTLRVEPGGAVQYWIHNPGDPFHGLITSRVHIIRDGQQTPSVVTTKSQFN